MATIDYSKGRRFSDADWSSEQRDIILVGTGGIGSWLSLNLSRVGHRLTLIDPDNVDVTNVEGGQMFNRDHVGVSKVDAVIDICRQMGCVNYLDGIHDYYTKDLGSFNIMMSGLDNMAGRKEVFEGWIERVNSLKDEEKSDCLLLDGRLQLEMFEIFAVRGDDEQAINKYRDNHLFSDEETVELACTGKQTTFGAMGIASFMTGILCNFLTNRKLGMEMREIQMYTRMFFPMMMLTTDHPVRPEAIVELTEQKTENV